MAKDHDFTLLDARLKASMKTKLYKVIAKLSNESIQTKRLSSTSLLVISKSLSHSYGMQRKREGLENKTSSTVQANQECLMKGRKAAKGQCKQVKCLYPFNIAGMHCICIEAGR